MDYNSVQDIIDAGTENMTVIRNNSKNDEGTDSITGVDWFSFNGTVASTIYASGNSWFGFGASSEQLKVNRRDAASWYIYREEGTLFSHYQFLKIRWVGYSHYGSTDNPYRLEYDVILWSTGQISLHMIAIPTSYNTGTYTLSNVSYSVNTSNPDVTFTIEDGEIIVENKLIDIQPPFDKKFLVRDENALYTIVESKLEVLEVSIEELCATTFIEYGIDILPSWELLQNLTNPQILYWYDSVDYTPKLIANIKATPFPQTIISERISLEDRTIKGIESVSADCDGELIVAVSFDDKKTWLAYNGEQWGILNEDFSGMSQEMIEDITADQWQEACADADAMYLRVSLTSTQQAIRQIYVSFLN